MKYTMKKKNARSKTEMFFRSDFAFIIMMLILIVLSAEDLRNSKALKAYENDAKCGWIEVMETEMSKCAQIGVKMQYAGADIEKKLLPELKLHLYCLNNLTDAFCTSFGENASPVAFHFLSKVNNACERLQMDYKSGYTADESEKALANCLMEFHEILKALDSE